MINKKGLTQFIVMLIFAIALLFTFGAIIAPAMITVIGTPNADIKSFERFVQQLVDMEPESSITLAAPNIETGGALLFVSDKRKEYSTPYNFDSRKYKNAQNYQDDYPSGIYGSDVPESSQYIFLDFFNWNAAGVNFDTRSFTKIPPECPEGKSCICMCRGEFESEYAKDAGCGPFCNRYVCHQSLHCISTQEIVIEQRNTINELFPHHSFLSSDDQFPKFFPINNGFFARYSDSVGDTVIPLIHSDQKSFSVSKSASNELSICMGRNCLAQK